MNRLAATTALSLTLVALAGCACPSKPAFFPVGLYGVKDTNDFAVVRNAGFNVVTGPANQSFLDAAQAAGLKVLASPGTSAGPKFDAAKARAAVDAFDYHPALWAWYIIDEPDMTGVSPDQVREAQRTLKRAWAHKPTALALYKGQEALHFGNIADLTMIDRYPVPWLPLASYGQHVRMTRLALGLDAPLIAIVQAFDWSYFKRQLPGETDLREPTYTELRNMVYVALTEQVSGLFFFAFDSGDWQLREHPELWEAVQQVAAEINERLPLFEAEHVWWRYSHDFDPYEGRFNEALESSVASALVRVREGNKVVPAGDYIVAVNTTGRAIGYSITAPPDFTRHSELETRNLVGEGDRGRGRGRFKVLGEGREVVIEKGWIKDEFGPYEVHVYGPSTKHQILNPAREATKRGD